jgi:hypothetical protein
MTRIIGKKQKRLFYFLFIAHVYCLISAWFNAGNKTEYPGSFFWHLLAWWCTWNSVITIAFVLWKSRRSKTNTYFAQTFSLITMISNLITMVIYGLGLIIWLITALTTYWGITDQTTKLVPIPSHKIGEMEVGKVIQWWSYSPLWHFVAPVYFIVWFFRYEKMNLLKKKLKLTILLCLIQPTLYFSYGWLRSRLGDRKYFKEFKARWVLPFLSSKKMSGKLGIARDYRFFWKIALALFWFSLFSLIAYLALRHNKEIRNYLISKKNYRAKNSKTTIAQKFVRGRRNKNV